MPNDNLSGDGTGDVDVRLFNILIGDVWSRSMGDFIAILMVSGEAFSSSVTAEPAQSTKGEELKTADSEPSRSMEVCAVWVASSVLCCSVVGGVEVLPAVGLSGVSMIGLVDEDQSFSSRRCLSLYLVVLRLS